MIKNTLQVLGTDIRVMKCNNDDYICITDMLKSKSGEFFIIDWLRNRNTLEFLGIREEVHNQSFNYGEFAVVKSQSWLNNYKIGVKQRIQKTNAIGLITREWRYWWTYAHKDIAFEFWMWISPKFKIYLIKEFQRLKEQELKSVDRNVKRFLTKMNYKIHTDAIKENLIPSELSPDQISYIYADEADVLNISLFGKTAKQWQNLYPNTSGNMRDEATIEQLIVLANLESINAEYIKLGIPQDQRVQLLNQTAISQMKSLVRYEREKRVKNLLL